MSKEPVIHFLTKLARGALTAGTSSAFRFEKPHTVTFPPLEKIGVYIHVPFCKQLCPYCPYNRIPYDAHVAAHYIQAVIKEMTYYARQLPDLQVTSVYIGGGTPTVLAKGLEQIIESVKTRFQVTGPVCVETNPADLSREKVQLLQAMEIDAVSLGVQSFHQPLLDAIGRGYTLTQIMHALDWLEHANFPTVNLDLLFALPGQRLQEFAEDLAKAASTFVDQITAYPLFTFPYSSVGQYRRLRHVEMPRLALRKAMYYFLYDYLTSKGFHRASVWSFKKAPDTHRYSSVTRERYLGFGPGAGSYYESLFTLNTFSVTEYIRAIEARGHAVALEMGFSRFLSILYDFYWRIYDTHIPKKRTLQNVTYQVADWKRLQILIQLGKVTGMLAEHPDSYSLTRKGAFWVHLLQNYFSLRYINTIWTAARRKPWPTSIQF